MNYYEIKFQYTSSVDTGIINDILAAELGEIGFESFTSDDNGLTAYIKETAYDPEALSGKLQQFPLPDVSFRYETELTEGKDWNEEWEKNYFQPIIIGDECIIHASFHTIGASYPFDIVIDPKMAFGTGNHETTRLVIRQLLDMDLTGKKVLDMGCGTAVLAILAAMKKAEEVVAIDIDEWAYRNALENIKLNGTTGIRVLLGGAEAIPADSSFDLVVANINRNILLQDIAAYSQSMRAGSQLIMSGFYQEDIPLIEAECGRCGLIPVSRHTENNWACILVRK